MNMLAYVFRPCSRSGDLRPNLYRVNEIKCKNFKYESFIHFFSCSKESNYIAGLKSQSFVTPD